MNLGLPIAAAVVVVALALRGRSDDNPDGPEGGTGAGGAGGVDLGGGSTFQQALGGAGGGAAAGFGIGGPLGALIGAVLGAVIGLFIGDNSFGNSTRLAVRKWLTDHGDAGHNGNVDAVLFRWCLLRFGRVWRSDSSGALGLAPLAVEQDAGALGGVSVKWVEPVDLGDEHVNRAADHLVSQAVWGQAHSAEGGRFDEARDEEAYAKRRTAAYRAWKRGARVGRVYPLTFYARGGNVDAKDLTGLAGFLAYYVRTRVRLSFTPAAGRWSPVDVTADNVDELAAGFDRHVRATWQAVSP